MDSSFSARIDELARQVGGGELVGSVIVDQIYAAYQLPDTTGSTSTILAAARRSTSRRRSWSTTTSISSASLRAS